MRINRANPEDPRPSRVLVWAQATAMSYQRPTIHSAPIVLDHHPCGPHLLFEGTL